MSVEIISGPPVSGPKGMSKEAAEQALLRNDSFPKGADYSIMAHQGHWVAAVSTPDFQKQAEFPPSGGGDDDSGSDGPPSGPPSDDSGSDDGGSSDGPPSEDSGSDGPPKHDKGEGKDGGGLHEIKDMLQTLLDALGLSPDGMGGDPMAGGPDGGPDGPPPPPHGGAGAAAPPGGPGEMRGGGRPLKPGETAPGGIPGGPPTFSSVSADHPWAHMLGNTAAFKVREALGANENIVDVHNELQSLAKSANCRVASFRPFHDENDNRYVEATIQTPTQTK